MAAIDLTRSSGNHKKRGVCVAVAAINFNDLATTDAGTLLKLPDNCVITSARGIVETPFDSTTAAIVVDVSGTALLASQDVKAVANTSKVAVASALNNVLPLGGDLIATMTSTGTATKGKYLIIVEYVEFTKATGELTAIN